jgi:hypothetical protein
MSLCNGSPLVGRSRTDPPLVVAASEVRAAIAAAATNPTGWATAEQLASRLDLPDAVKPLHLSVVASVDIGYVVRDSAADHRGLTAPARIIGMRAQGGGDPDRAGSDPLRRRHLDHAQPNRGQSTDPVPEPARRGLINLADDVIATTNHAVTAAAQRDPSDSAQRTKPPAELAAGRAGRCTDRLPCPGA